MTPNEMVTFNRGGDWANKWYTKVPVPFNMKQHHVASCKTTEPKISEAVKDALRKKNLPAPNQYIKCLNWAAESTKNRDNF